MKTRKIRGAIRPVAGRREIFAAGVPSEFAPVGRQSPSGPWHSSLGYTSPLLYEHFRDKQEILTELAIEGQVSLASRFSISLFLLTDGTPRQLAHSFSLTRFDHVGD